jgi:NitT/TauT family transport system permease protein
MRELATVAGSLVTFLVFWSLLAWWLAKPAFLPSPAETLEGAVELIRSGELPIDIAVSFARIITGFLLGTIVGIPLGLCMGMSKFVRSFMDPYVEFFRFIPPIAFVTLAVIWFGLGETSKIVLIVYTTMFMISINTMIGVLSIDPDKIFAARSLGASNRQVFFHIVIPASVPQIITGMKIAMGNSFMTVISAEMIAARSGVGYLIFNSRLFLLTSYIFVGIIALGLMGLLTDRLLRYVTHRFLGRYEVKF